MSTSKLPDRQPADQQIHGYATQGRLGERTVRSPVPNLDMLARPGDNTFWHALVVLC